MAMEITQQQKLSQKLILTPHLQMAIKLLQLSRIDLLDLINHELEENPVLDEGVWNESENYGSEDPDKSILDKAIDDKESLKEVVIEDKIADFQEFNNYLNEYNSIGKASFEVEKKDSYNFESNLVKRESLEEHLLWQLMMTFPGKKETKIGKLIAGNLNTNGYLDISLKEIAKLSGCSRKKVEESLSLMQTFNPVGVCARDLKECLLIQAKHLGFDNTLVIKILQHRIEYLENKDVHPLRKTLGIKKKDVDLVRNALEIIKSLEPKPGRQFSDDTYQYITPDIFVYQMDGEFVIVLNEDGMPKLHINSLYNKKLSSESDNISSQGKTYIEGKMKSALWFVRSIRERQKTIYMVMESILKFQKEFFKKGVVHIKPLVLKDVAIDINMHESTISRVTANKFVETPFGLFSLKYFFNSHIQQVDGQEIASVSVREKIQRLIESEDKKKPLSDKQISEILKKSNINIARRTVGKYRDILNILSSSKRKEF